MRLTAVVLLISCLPTAGAQTFGDADPLFRSDEVLALHIAAPLTTLMEERPDEEELAGTARWNAADGSLVTVAVDIRTRGNYRRQRDVCPFAPLRLDFRKSEVEGTLFDAQDKLKLVTHCKNDSRRNQQFLLREYLVYRMFNTLSDLSYRVRLLEITWENTEDPRSNFVAPGILIESDERLAKRVGLPPSTLERTTADTLDPAYTNLAAIFHYFIGNTDFSPMAGPAGDTCCHNSTLFGPDGGPYFPVPYDFDMSGMVNTDYASPNPRFGIRDVQTRLYRGRCAHIDYTAQSLALFREHEAELYAWIDYLDALASWPRKDMRGFMDKFFRTIGDPDDVQKQIVDRCVE
ncbi:MAG TPA: hypothetical protein VFY03_04975 [Woeseiaceae bacterium]|nr:hypothetical protein [Woeseiaceae bacterium]